MIEHEFLEYLPEYATGTLGGPEQDRLEEHLTRGCELCEMELLLFSETAGRLPYALPDVRMPERLKARIRARLTGEDLLQSTAVRRTGFLRFLPAAAMIACVLAAGILLWRQSRVLEQKEQAILELQETLHSQHDEISWLRDPAVQLALLTGQAPASPAKGKMLWNPSVSKGLFYASFLPPLESGKSYQLWVIGSTGPVSAGVFDPDQNGAAVITISTIRGTAAGSLQFAVTIEPRGGLLQPSGLMILAGKPI